MELFVCIIAVQKKSFYCSLIMTRGCPITTRLENALNSDYSMVIPPITSRGGAVPSTAMLSGRRM